MLPKAQQRTPKHLRSDTALWWESVVKGWELDPHHVLLLTLAAEAWDRCAMAREAIERDGLTVATDDGGVKLNPAARVEDASRIAFARLLRELDLDITTPATTTKRPPQLRSMRRGTDGAA